MAYDYQTERPGLFTEEGVAMLAAIRDETRRRIGLAGAVRWQEAVGTATGDTWLMLACIGYMVEKGEIRKVTGPDVPWQHRVFVAAA